MPVNTEHGQYARMVQIWKRCRAAIGGESDVKAGDVDYLPRMKKQTTDDYSAYKERAVYFNATGRTHDTFLGLMFRNAPIVTIPTSMEAWAQDIAFTGETIYEFIKRIASEVLAVGRCGVLVDMPRVDVPLASQAEYEQMGIRPYCALYLAESIINWKSDKAGLTLLVLREALELPGSDVYSTKSDKYKYRVLTRTADGVHGEVWAQVGDKPEWQMLESYTLMLATDKPLAHIPFIIFDPVSGTPDIDEPPLLDLVHINLAHYRNSADYENGLHWTGTPTPVFIGSFVSEDSEPVAEVKLGSTAGIHLAMGGDAKFLEFSGQGISGIKDAMSEKRDMMAVLGARALTGEKNGVEASETAQIYRTGESSLLAGVANSISRQWTRTLEIMRDWGRQTGNVSVQISTDYLISRMDSGELTALVNALIGGAIGKVDFFNAVKRGGILEKDRDFDEFDADTELLNTKTASGIGGNDGNTAQ